jgi:serine protease Do
LAKAGIYETNPEKSDANIMSTGRRMVVTVGIIGLLAGIIGSYVFIRFLPGVIPVDKRQVLLQEDSAAVNVAKQVSPSVVSITSDTTTTGFFGNTQTQQGAGTGIIVRADGLILTNKHVVPSDAGNFSVFTADGHEYKNARVVARDPNNDIAFVQIDANGLKAAELGDSSQVRVGQKVIAIGNALGQFQNTVTEGLISGLGRPIVAGDQGSSDQEALQNLLQTDAAINPGNSGGPLVDLTGQVIGMNTAVAGDAQGIGFAIPINEAKSDIASVEGNGKITKAYLGVRFVAITKEFASKNNLPVSNGAYVSGDQSNPAVVPGSPADKAGLKDGDIITKVAGQAIDQTHPLTTLIGQHKPGDSVALTVLRDGKEQSINVNLSEAPSQ